LFEGGVVVLDAGQPRGLWLGERIGNGASGEGRNLGIAADVRGDTHLGGRREDRADGKDERLLSGERHEERRRLLRGCRRLAGRDRERDCCGSSSD
jgi:hypothetical protein